MPDDPRPARPGRQRLGQVLLDAEVIDEQALEQTLDVKASGERLGQALLRLGVVDETTLADALARQLGLERVEPDRLTVQQEALDRLPEHVADRHRVLPVRLEDGVLVLATDDPSDVVALDDVRLAARVRSVRPVVATTSALERARQRVRRRDDDLDALQHAAVADEEPEDDVEVASDQPVIRLVDQLIADALRLRGSDLHVEPDADGVAIRVRVDGLLRETRRLPRVLGRQVLSRLKIMGQLDIAERRLPQDGRAVLRMKDQEVDLRLSSMPTLYGETIVVRLLPKGAERLTLGELGHGPDVLDAFKDALERPQGLVLVTGPTGSGKTSTLYAGLQAVADPTRNVLTLEDPIEVELAGVNQTQIDPRIGLTFATGLRSVLRQDPDVVLVGEIRDRETAQLAVEASFTGHLVLATLHTNDAPSSVARLVDLGADRFLVASALLLVVAQRLARRVCPDCAIDDVPSAELLDRLGLDALPEGATPRRGTGCIACDDTGTLGRIAIGEVLRVTPELRELVLQGASESRIAGAAAAGGLRSLRAEALDRAYAGEIELAEARRITPDPGAVDTGATPE
ncbi:MAG: type II/IV secretion system protein [Nitriliruptoraceae bacterium]|nr:type II/IV secretion system protein [Nitriliruptoraceae bacterium]